MGANVLSFPLCGGREVVFPCVGRDLVGPGATSRHTPACASHDPPTSCSSVLEIFLVRGTEVDPIQAASLTLALLNRDIPEPLDPSVCDSEGKPL